mmetsp:Transcript_26945/g.67737  ORF Transcript_26945/g.67737 Transcript_26945/m.67737 type:complete len:257 (+) Transcript_26945:106-876(+)
METSQALVHHPKVHLRWPALWSDPSLFTHLFAALLQAPADVSVSCFDVYALDASLFSSFPGETMALLLAFPETDEEEVAKMSVSDSFIDSRASTEDDAYFIFQADELENACGTLAAIHTVLNCPPLCAHLGDALLEFTAQHGESSPRARGASLAKSLALNQVHCAVVAPYDYLGEEEPEEPEMVVDHHFVTLLLRERDVLLIDGRDPAGPRLQHQASEDETDESVLELALRVVREQFLSSRADRPFALLSVQSLIH